MPKPVVIVIRDPDHDNEIHTFGNVSVHDIDLGRSDLDNKDEAWDWATSHLQFALEYIGDGCPEAGKLVTNVVRNRVEGVIDFDAAVGEAAYEHAMSIIAKAKETS